MSYEVDWCWAYIVLVFLRRFGEAGLLPPWRGGPRLISLWDIMKTLDLAKAFQLRAGCQSAATFLDPTQITWISGQDETLEPRLRASLVAHYIQVSEFCKAFDLPISQASCNEIITLLDSQDTAKGRYLNSPTRELPKRIHEELQSRLFLYMRNQSAALYEHPLEGWDKSQEAFPSAIYDVEEAAKCFALQRSTACVFHTMRVVEHGLKSLAAKFNIGVNHRAWGEIIDQINAAIHGIKKQPSKPADWKEDERFYSEAASQFMHFKNAWRNYTAHSHFKYTEEEAETIFRHARDFMEHIAKRLTEATS